MLVLSRKAQETIMIGDITVTVLKISYGSVRIGIDAPREMQVLRGELQVLQCEQEAVRQEQFSTGAHGGVPGV